MSPQKKITLFLLLTLFLSTFAYIPLIRIGMQNEERAPFHAFNPRWIFPIVIMKNGMAQGTHGN
jgi:hypothetical protein